MAYKKIEFSNNKRPSINAENLNAMQDNAEEYINEEIEKIPKVELSERKNVEGTSITLQDSSISPMEISVKGNEPMQENEPSVTNPSEVQVVDGNYDIVKSNKNLLNIPNQKVVVSGVTFEVIDNVIHYYGNWNTGGNWILLDINLTLEVGTYTISDIFDGTLKGMTIGTSTSDFIQKNTFTLTERKTFTKLLNWTNGLGIVNNRTLKIQLERGTQATDYVEHKEEVYQLDLTNRNLFDKDNYTNAYISNTGSIVIADNIALFNYIKVDKNTKYLFTQINSYEFRCCAFDKNKNFISRTDSFSVKSKVIETDNSTEYIRIFINLNKTPSKELIDENNPVLTKGDKELSYQSCYESGSINLFNKNGKLENGYLSNGVVTANADWRVTDYIDISQYQFLTTSGSTATTNQHYFYNENKSSLSFFTGQITTKIPINAKYVRLTIKATDLNTYQLNGTYLYSLYNDTDYFYKENGKWYVHNEWGKAYFKDFISAISSVDGNTKWDAAIKFNIKINCVDNINNISNMFSNIGYKSSQNLLADTSLKNGIAFAQWGTQKYIYFSRSYGSTNTEAYNNIIANNNYLVYELETPTNTEITSNTLISQLEALSSTLGYDTITNFDITGNALNPILRVDYNTKTKLGLETKVSYEELEKVENRIYKLEQANIYSTDEVICGWDSETNKPIYRKKFKIFTLPSTNTNFISVSNLNIDELFEFSGFIYAENGSKFPINLNDSTSNYSVLFISNENYIRGRGAVGGSALKKITLTLRYTKTTD